MQRLRLNDLVPAVAAPTAAAAASVIVVPVEVVVVAAWVIVVGVTSAQEIPLLSPHSASY